MSKKRKTKKRPADAQLFQRAQVELDKGNARSALKTAKLCFRQAPSPANRQLLEQAYVIRAEQLQRSGLSSEACALLEQLMQMGTSSPHLQPRVSRLMVMVGSAGANVAEVVEQDPLVLQEAVDQAILHQQTQVPNYAGLKTQVPRLYQALAAVERGDDEAAVELVRDIHRSSPLYDWRLFVRGLSAFYQSNRQLADNAWRRLDESRPAYRLAQTLLVAAGEVAAENAPIDLTVPLRRLDKYLDADPVAGMVKKLADLGRRNAWRDFGLALGRLRQGFSATHASLIEKILDVTWKQAVQEKNPAILTALTRSGPGPALDPNWLRFRGLLAERGCDVEYTSLENIWTSYADNVASLPCLRPDERAIASGLVYLRMARDVCEESERFGSSPFSSASRQQDPELQALAVKFFRESISRCPQLADAYRELASLYEEMEESGRAVQVREQLLEQHPDEIDAHYWLASYFLGNEEPARSEPHVQAVYRLRPRDWRTIDLRTNQQLATIRACTKKRQFEAAIETWEELRQAPPPGMEPYAIDCIRAGIEFKAKNHNPAKQHLDAAVSAVAEPTVVWLQMSCLAARFSLARNVKKDFDDRFKKDVKKKTDGQTAGCLARFMASMKARQFNYTGRATQERLIVDYLKRCVSADWHEDDLRGACDLAFRVPRQRKLQVQLVDRGLDRFPDAAWLHLFAGQLEMEQGIYLCDLDKAIGHMKRVLELARGSNDPRDQALIKSAEMALSLLEDAQKRFRGPSPIDYDDEDDDDDEYDEYEEDYEDDDDDDDDEYFGPNAFSAPWTPGRNGDADPSAPPKLTGLDKIKMGLPPHLTAEDVLAKLKADIPPELIAEFQRMARAEGVHPDRLLLDWFKETMQSTEREERQSRRRGSKSRSKKKQKKKR